MKLEALIPLLPGPALLMSDDGRIRCASPAVEDLFGVPTAELVGEVLDSILTAPEPDAGGPSRNGGGTPSAVTDARRAMGRRPDGGVVPVTVSLVPLSRDQGPMVLALLQDLSEAEAKDEARVRSRKLETLGRLATGVVHDFNNLLTLITGGATTLSRILPEGHEGRAEAEAILEAGRRAASLTRRLLMMAREEPRKSVPVDLNEVVAGLEPVLSRLFSADIRIETRLGKGLDPVCADPDEIGQVVLNLAVNASEAMPGGGTLTFATESVPASAEASVSPTGSDHEDRPGTPFVRLRVVDTGIGMDEKTRARIFDSYFTTKRDGSGLGLPTVLEIVERLGGAVHVDSTPGAGSEFSVVFPALATAEAASGGS